MASIELLVFPPMNRAHHRVREEAYQYSPLDKDRKEIRLITLRAGRFSDEIHVTLFTAVLTEDSIPVYEALSYAWGSQEDPVDIVIGPRDKRLAVTRNLAEALPYLRYTDKPRVLWIDAICVNQQDSNERSRQVQRMPDVYSMAYRVIVWLGTASEDSDVALKVLKEMALHVEVDWVSHEVKPSLRGDVNRDFSERGITLPYKKPVLEALSSVLSRSWFERLWVWQEIHLANEQALIVCGYDEISWHDFRKSVLCIWRKKTLVSYHLADRVKNVFTFCNNPEPDLTSLLETARASKCADPRDKIFAVMGIAVRSVHANSWEPPDYGKSTAEVYQKTIMQYIRYERNLRILRLCQAEVALQRENDLPSWVPDLRVPGLELPNSFHQHASTATSAIVEFEGASRMKVKGVLSLEISNVWDLAKPDDSSYSSTMNTIRDLASFIGLSGDYDACGAAFEDFCTLFSSGRFSDTFSPLSSNYPTSEQASRCLSSILAQPNIDYHEVQRCCNNTDLFLGWAKASINNQCFFTTSDETFGLAFKGAMQGDLIYVLLGCEFPVVMRKISEGTFKFVGACYVNKLVNGEAILGPLPSGCRIVWKYFPRPNEWYPVFYENLELETGNGHGHTMTGKFHIEDPRLGEMPQGWRSASHEDKDGMVLYENEETGERTEEHPSLRLEALIARGVDLQDVVLV
jgi:hypothetical protein